MPTLCSHETIKLYKNSKDIKRGEKKTTTGNCFVWS